MNKTFSSWRGTLGVVQPTMRPGVTEDLIRMLPPGIGVIPLFNNIRQGSREEFRDVIAGFEGKTAELADAGVDLIHPGGAPPFMLLGFAAESALIADWERRFGVPILTSGSNQIAALTALGVRTILGVTYFPADLNEVYTQYFRDAGFTVLEMSGMNVPFAQVGELSSHAVYAHAKRAFLAHPEAEAIYLLGAGWRTLDVIEPLEQDCGVPVIQQIATLSWEVQCRLRVRQPVSGYGRLLADMPPLPPR